MKRKVFIFIAMLLCGTALWFAFSPLNSETTAPKPAPSSTTIKLTHISALDYCNCSYYPYHELKVTFYGSRYSDGQEVWDPNSPFISGPLYFVEPTYCACANFYYRDGIAYIYTRPNSSSSWVYQGEMYMSSSNCTMDGSKVTMFTINCQYLYNPE